MSSTTSASASASATGEAAPSSTSLSSLVSTLVPTLIIAAVYVGIFLVLRRTQKRFYAPRTYLGSLRESERTPALPTGLFNWFGAFWNIKDTYALQHQGLDAFLFLRFLRTIVFIMFMGCVMLWPIMFPVNATGGAGALQLDMLSYSNIDNKTQYNRYYAHVFTAWLYYGFVMYTILRETIYYINLRQAFLMSPFFANRISTRTVLFTGVPEQYLDEAKLRKVFGDVAKTIWITGDTEELDKLVKERDKVAMRLEKAEVKLIKLANAERLKAIKNGGSDERTEAPADAETGNLAARWVPDKKRPTHRTGFLGLVGPKVDSITWCRTELERLIPEVGKAQATYRSGTGKKIPGVFIEFFTQAQAEAAHQTLTHHQALQMTPKYIGITPGEVVWSSLKVSWWQRVVRRYAVIGFITAMIVFWAAPVAFVGSISNIDSLKTISFLTWLDKIPPVIMGVVSGLLPAVALAILMALVPIVMRICAKLSGEPSLSRVELFTQNAYFAFQVIQVFLVATLGSVATSVGKQIADNPASATTLLAQNIPKASNLYIPFFIVQGLTIASGVLSQVVGFIIFNLLYKYLAGTPRAMYIKWANMATISWGSVLPVYTNIAVISIVYAGIAPLVLGFATIGLFLFYLAYKYNILFVTDTTIDTRGLIYPRALKHLFAGIYVAEVCMVGLFAASVAVGPLVLMVAFLVFTILFHMTINSALDPLLYNLPQTLVAEEQMLRDGAARIASAETDPKNGAAEKNGAGAPETEAPVKGGMVASFLKPWQFADYATLRKLVPHNSIDVNSLYSDEVEKHAYYPPTVTSPTPLLWIPEDAAGISKQEIRDTGKVIPITDEGCTLSDKNKLEWDTETVRPPVWEEKVYY